MKTVTSYDRLSDWVDNHLDESIAFLREMVRVPTDTPPGDNARHAAHAAQLLGHMGFAVEKHPVPDADVKAQGLTSLTNLIVRKRFGDGPVIALNVHGDVVPPGAGWTKPPYAGVIEDGRMYGRGVAVSKSDFATYAYALRAVASLGEQLHGTVELHITYDEEFGGLLGPAWILARGLSKPDLALGAGFSYAVTTAHDGCLQLQVSVRGRSAHAAMPETGVDALRAAVRILEAIYAQNAVYAQRRSARARHRLAHGHRRADRRRDQHQRRARRGRAETRPADDPRGGPGGRRVRAARRDRAAAWDSPGVVVEIRRLLLARALTPLPGHEQLVELLQKHAADVRRRGHSARPARRSTPTRGCTAKRACRPCSTAPGRARSSKPTPSAPTRTWSSRTCAARPRWSRARSTTCLNARPARLRRTRAGAKLHATVGAPAPARAAVPPASGATRSPRSA